MGLLKIDNEIVNDTLLVKQGESLVYNLACFKGIKPCKIEINLEENSSLDMNFADFGPWSGELNIVVNMNGEGGVLRFRCASYSSVNEKKRVSVDVNHLGNRGDSLVSCYGIVSGKSEIHFEGSSFIQKGSVGTRTRQEAKAILFDPLSQGYCSPVLKIDENDVAASHAASVGRVNDDHLFYLLSRGLSVSEARKLISLGYLKPIVAHFEGEEIQQRLLSAIEEKI